MSFVRWGSACGQWGRPNDCPEGEKCPGSSVYIYESVYGGIECCGCDVGDRHNFDTDAEVLVHLEAHRAAKHHVPERVMRGFRGEPEPIEVTEEEMMAYMVHAALDNKGGMSQVAWDRGRKALAEFFSSEKVKGE